MNATATTPTTVTIPTTVTTPTIPTRSVHDITGDNYAELTAIAASVGINWQSVSEQITSYPFKITRGIELERKYQGKVACFGRLYKSKSGKEYPRINFHTNKHGGITETWNGYNAEHDNPIPFTPKPRQPKTKDNSDEWRTKRFNAAKALFKDLPTETGEHSYLISKFQAQAPDVAKLTDIRRGADEHGSYIMVELMRSGFVAGYQKIYDKNIKSRETNKDYIVNAEGKNGAYLLIDGDSDKIYITEGLATGLTVAFATGNTVAVALDAGNIIHVAESLAGQNITIAADNDAGNNGNTGILKAIEAAKKFGCKVVAPNTEYKADYNDIFIEGGIDSVRTHLANKIKVEKNRFSFELQRIKSLPEAQKPKAVKKAVAAGMAGVPFKYSLGDVVSRVSSVYPNIEPIIESANYLLKKKEEAVSQYMNFDDGEFTRVAPNAETILRAGGVYILNWGMGAGKTKFMCEVAAAAEKNNLSTMYLTHRVAIVDNAATRLGATHYQDVNELDMRHVRTLVSCINSLTKPYIAAYAADAGVLKIDEVRQVLEAIATGTVSKHEKPKTFDKLRKQVANARTVIAADADIDLKTIEFLKSCGRELYVVDPPEGYVPPQKAVIHGSYKQVETHALEAVRNKERCLIFTDSKEHSATLEQECLKAGVTPLIINSDTRGDRDQKEFLGNPNIDKGFKVVIATPVISSGFSIEKDLFDKVFMLSQGVLAMNEIVQTAARYRPAKEVIIGFKDWRADRVDEEDELALLAKQGDPTDFSEWHVKCEALEQNARAYGASGVLMAFEMKGWELKRLGGVLPTIKTGESKAAAQENLFNDVRNAKDIDGTTAEKIKKSYSNTYVEVCELEKHAVKTNLVQDEFTSDDFTFWNRGKVLPNINNADITSRSIDECKALDKYEIESGIDISLRTNAEDTHVVFNQLLKLMEGSDETGHIEKSYLNSSNLCALNETGHIEKSYLNSSNLCALNETGHIEKSYLNSSNLCALNETGHIKKSYLNSSNLCALNETGHIEKSYLNSSNLCALNETGHIKKSYLNSSNLCALEITTKGSIDFLEWCRDNAEIAWRAGIKVTTINRTYAIRSVIHILGKLGIKVNRLKSNGKRTYTVNTESVERIRGILVSRRGRIGIFKHLEGSVNDFKDVGSVVSAVSVVYAPPSPIKRQRLRMTKTDGVSTIVVSAKPLNEAVEGLIMKFGDRLASIVDLSTNQLIAI